MENTTRGIELEPRTLSQVQLTQAREVAAEVVQKLKPTEATTLFLELIHPIKEVRQIEENESQVEYSIDCKENEEVIPNEKACYCQCSCISENPLHSNLKEPLSAPF